MDRIDLSDRVVDFRREEVRGRDGTRVELRPRAFGVLRRLAMGDGALVTKDELLTECWPGVIVTEDSLTQCISEIRKALGEGGRDLIRTVPRRGYALVLGGAEQSPPPPTQAVVASGQPGPQPVQPSLPSLVVLPFQNMSGDVEQEYLADGITEELTTALSRIRSFFVIARNSAFTYKGRAVDVRQVGRDLGVRYVVEGAVRKAGNRVRITGQLIEAEAGRHVWADRFDGALEDVFELQDRVTEAIAGTIEPSLRAAEIERARSKPTEHLSAYDLYLRALPHRYAHTKSDNDTALALLRRATEADPNFTLARALAALTYGIRRNQGWSNTEEDAEGLRLARQALAASTDDPSTLRMAALAISSLGREFEAGLGAVDRALALNRNSAEVTNSAAWIHNFTGEPTVAIQLFKRAMRLSPLDPEMASMMSGIGMAHLIAGDSVAALEWGQRSIRHTPGWSQGHRLVIVALVRLGRNTDAREAVAALLCVAPQMRVGRIPNPYRDEGFMERYLDALRTAGLPE